MASKNHNNKGSKKAQGIANPLNKRLFDLKEASIYLGRPVFSVSGLIWKGVSPVIKDGRKLYVDLYDLNEYVEKHKERMI